MVRLSHQVQQLDRGQDPRQLYRLLACLSPRHSNDDRQVVNRGIHHHHRKRNNRTQKTVLTHRPTMPTFLGIIYSVPRAQRGDRLSMPGCHIVHHHLDKYIQPNDRSQEL